MTNDQKSTFQLTIDFLRKSWEKIQKWLRTVPSDSIGQKVLKTLGKVLAVILTIIFSPVILITLILAFLIAF